jgi:hypothetical protein
MPEWGYWSLFFVVSLGIAGRRASPRPWLGTPGSGRHQHASAAAERHHVEPGPAQRTRPRLLAEPLSVQVPL